MILIAFEKNVLLGGFGDRVIGLISCKIIANLLQQEFYIFWNKENIREYIDYSKYDFELKEIELDDLKLYNCIDYQSNTCDGGNSFKNYLKNSTKLFTNKINKFYLNQEISQYLYKNKLFTNKNYLEDIINAYKELYTDILKPTNKILSVVNKLIYNKSNIIGIQIRAGDKFMDTNKGEKHCCINNPNVEIKNILQKIKLHCDTNNDNYYIFLTSDYSKIFDISLEIWNENKIIYVNDIIQHIDRKSLNSDISKIFIDSYILSQKTNAIYISDYSNFGRIAALSSIHNNIFNLNTKPINIKNLITKHEMIF